MAEYAAAYGGPPAPDMPWPMFVLLLERTPRFEARVRLGLVDSVAMAIGAAFGGGAQTGLDRDRLYRAAYPVTRTGPKMVRNLAAERAASEDGDGRAE